MKTMVTIDELKRLAARNVVSLPHEEDEPAGSNDGSPLPWLAEGRERSARVAELMRSVHELTKNRSHYDTADLERWLDERDD